MNQRGVNFHNALLAPKRVLPYPLSRAQNRKELPVKVLLSVFVVALSLLTAPASHAAPDYYGMCKTELGKVASGAQAYLGSQSAECASALDQPAGGRNDGQIRQLCTNTGVIAQLKNRAYAVCGQCRRLGNSAINNACTDNGLSSFISAVGAL